MFRFSLTIGFLLTLFSLCAAEDSPTTYGLYGARMTANNWEELVNPQDELDIRNSYLIAALVAKQIGTYGQRASFEIEGQVVKHCHIQNHWEFNALATARWKAFAWDRFVNTSLAFGLGPSYASEKPILEERINDKTQRFLVYWMMELTLAHPRYPNFQLCARIHHRSNAYGLVGEDGGSNALGLGFKILR